MCYEKIDCSILVSFEADTYGVLLGLYVPTDLTLITNRIVIIVRPTSATVILFPCNSIRISEWWLGSARSKRVFPNRTAHGVPRDVAVGLTSACLPRHITPIQ